MEGHVILTPKEELERRLLSFRILMEREGIDACFLHYKVDYYYFSGTMQDALMYIPRESNPILFVKREIERAKRESQIENILPFKSYSDVRDLLPSLRRVGLQLDVLPFKEFIKFKEVFDGPEFVDCSPLIRELRMRKSEFEIMLLKRASMIQKSVYDYAKSIIREGMSEIELGGLLEAYAKTLGHEGLLRMRSLNYEAYSWHILSGESGSVVSQSDSPMGGYGLSPAFPVGASRKRIRKGEPILIDFGVSYHGYHVDKTRVFALGSIPEKFVLAQRVSIEIEKRILDMIPKGLKSKDLFELSLRIAEDSGFGKFFLGYGKDKVKFLAHGVGLELSEPPYIAKNHDYRIEEGSVLAIEPKFVFPGEGACGVENTVLVKNGICEILTDSEEDIVIL